VILAWRTDIGSVRVLQISPPVGIRNVEHHPRPGMMLGLCLFIGGCQTFLFSDEATFADPGGVPGLSNCRTMVRTGDRNVEHLTLRAFSDGASCARRPAITDAAPS
jgi:hypothetical protein